MHWARHHVLAAILGTAAIAGCVPVQPTPDPVPKAKYSYIPTSPCAPPGSAKITLAIVSPQWQEPRSNGLAVQSGSVGPAAFASDLTDAMRADFLQLVTCRGYLARGPFDSFDAMVYPDRQASQLLLEPELQISVQLADISRLQPDFLTAVLNKAAPSKLRATASIGGRVNLNLKEPITDTRMWSRSIAVPTDTVTFDTDNTYPQGITVEYGRAAIMQDPALARALIPRLEATYKRVFATADGYLNRQELTTVAVQATDVRKKASIRVPPR